APLCYRRRNCECYGSCLLPSGSDWRGAAISAAPSLLLGTVDIRGCRLIPVHGTYSARKSQHCNHLQNAQAAIACVTRAARAPLPAHSAVRARLRTRRARVAPLCGPTPHSRGSAALDWTCPGAVRVLASRRL